MARKNENATPNLGKSRAEKVQEISDRAVKSARHQMVKSGVFAAQDLLDECEQGANDIINIGLSTETYGEAELIYRFAFWGAVAQVIDQLSRDGKATIAFEVSK